MKRMPRNQSRLVYLNALVGLATRGRLVVVGSYDDIKDAANTAREREAYDPISDYHAIRSGAFWDAMESAGAHVYGGNRGRGPIVTALNERLLFAWVRDFFGPRAEEVCREEFAKRVAQAQGGTAIV
jgi:hypothetical protein